MKIQNRISSEKWEEIDEELKYNENDELGSGGYGSVFIGKFVLRSKNLLPLFGGRKKIDVAVKRIDPKKIQLEDEILIKVRNHRNVLNFYCAKDKMGWR